jgi:hypothetical protein
MYIEHTIICYMHVMIVMSLVTFHALVLENVTSISNMLQVGIKLKNVQEDELIKQTCKTLTHHYYEANPKQSMKRAIAR